MTMAPDAAFPPLSPRAADDRSDDASSPYGWIEGLLARYPDLPPEELDRLVAWFEREASAQDVGMVASDPRIQNQYRRFRNEHIDPLTLRDIGRAAVFVTIIGLATLGVAWLSL